MNNTHQQYLSPLLFQELDSGSQECGDSPASLSGK